MSASRVESLRRAVEASPDDTTLRLMLAEALVATGAGPEALEQYGALLAADAVPHELLVEVGLLAIGAGRLDIAKTCAARAREVGVVEGAAWLEREIEAALAQRGLVRLRADGGDDGDDSAQALPEVETTTFDAAGGMAEVKKIIHRLIVLPLSRPELYQHYGRKAGGGVMLYGPPGCGKTLLARATAGECGLPFVNVRIEDVVDPYVGMSERNLHRAFERAREAAPAVLFVDELDGLAYARHRHDSAAGRRLVDVLLQELDAIGSDNADLLVLGSTNAPWDVDGALLRPGRFDRAIFVPPPDQAARESVLGLMLREVETSGVDLRKLAAAAPLFSGADLRHVVDRATDLVIDDALSTGTHPPLSGRHLEAAVAAVRPSTLDWLGRAKAYVEFANATERYDDVAKYLRSGEVRRRLGKDR